MKIPQIGDTITTQWALELCEYFGLDYLVKRIQDNPDAYRDWEFDGCSGFRDQLLRYFKWLIKAAWQDITNECCLPHDLSFAYGDPGNKKEFKMVNKKFFIDLVKVGTKAWAARIFKYAVKTFGWKNFRFNRNYKWAYALKKITGLKR